MTIIEKTAIEQRHALLNKEISAKELLDLTYKNIEEKDEKIGAYNSLTKEYAYETARKVDEKIAKGEELPLMAGIPLALKDNMNLKGSYTTASSKILENFVSPYDATVVTKLKENLAIMEAGFAKMDMETLQENSGEIASLLEDLDK